MRHKREIIGIVSLVLLVSGCATGGLVCRHNAMADAAWASEQGLDYEIVVYAIPKAMTFGIWDGHVQVKTDKGWISTFWGFPTFRENSDWDRKGWEGRYNVERYMLLLRRNCFSDIEDCRDEGIPFRGMLP